MNLVSDLDLPAFGYTAPDFSADRYYHRRTFLPIIWPGSSKVNPNRGPVPYVS